MGTFEENREYRAKKLEELKNIARQEEYEKFGVSSEETYQMALTSDKLKFAASVFCSFTGKPEAITKNSVPYIPGNHKDKYPLHGIFNILRTDFLTNEILLSAAKQKYCRIANKESRYAEIKLVHKTNAELIKEQTGNEINTELFQDYLSKQLELILINDREHNFHNPKQTYISPEIFIEKIYLLEEAKKEFHQQLAHYNNPIEIKSTGNIEEDHATRLFWTNKRRDYLNEKAVALKNHITDLGALLNISVPYSVSLARHLNIPVSEQEKIARSILNNPEVEKPTGYAVFKEGSYVKHYFDLIDNQKAEIRNIEKHPENNHNSIFSQLAEKDPEHKALNMFDPEYAVSEEDFTEQKLLVNQDIYYSREKVCDGINNHFSSITRQFLGELNVITLLNNTMIFKHSIGTSSMGNTPKPIHQKDHTKTLTKFPFITETMAKRLNAFTQIYHDDLKYLTQAIKNESKQGKGRIAQVLSYSIRSTQKEILNSLGTNFENKFTDAIKDIKESIYKRAADQNEQDNNRGDRYRRHGFNNFNFRDL